MFHGADPTGANALAQQLLRVSGALQGLIDRVLHAESLADYPTAAVAPLDDASLVLRATASALETAAHQIGTFRVSLPERSRPLARYRRSQPGGRRSLEHPEIRAKIQRSGDGTDPPFDPRELLADYWDQGVVFTGAHRLWIGLTRTTTDDINGFDAWAEANGYSKKDAYLLLAQYKAMVDKGTNAAVAHGRNPTRLEEFEAELRAVYVSIRLKAAKEGWTPEQIAAADRGVIDYFADSSDGEAAGGYSFRATSFAYQLLAGKAALGIELPTLSDAELAWVIAVGGDPANQTAVNTDILSVAAAVAGNNDSAVTVGLRAIATSADVLVLLQAIAIGDTQTVREKTADIGAGSAIVAAAKWLMPRVVGGPVTVLAGLIIALTQVGPPPGGRPSNPPAVGWVDEYGRVQNNGPCLAVAGLPDRIACGG